MIFIMNSITICLSSGCHTKYHKLYGLTAEICFSQFGSYAFEISVPAWKVFGESSVVLHMGEERKKFLLRDISPTIRTPLITE